MEGGGVQEDFKLHTLGGGGVQEDFKQHTLSQLRGQSCWKGSMLRPTRHPKTFGIQACGICFYR